MRRSDYQPTPEQAQEAANALAYCEGVEALMLQHGFTSFDTALIRANSIDGFTTDFMNFAFEVWVTRLTDVEARIKRGDRVPLIREEELAPFLLLAGTSHLVWEQVYERGIRPQVEAWLSAFGVTVDYILDDAR